MKFTTQAQTLADHLYRVQGIVSGKSTMPALSHVLMRADGQQLRLRATDLELAMEDTLNVTVQQAGVVALPAKSLFEVVKTLPAGADVTVVALDNQRIEVKAGKAQFKLLGVPTSDFPEIAQVNAQNRLSLRARDLARMIDGTLFCVSTDDARYNLTGLYWEGGEDGSTLRFVATDGHRLAVCERSIEGGVAIKPVIVPKKALVELKRLIGSAPAEDLMVECGFSDNHVLFTVGGVQLSSRLIEGQFPDYTQVIPKSSPNVVKASRAELVEALKRVSLLSPDKSFGVKLHFGSGVVTVESQNPALGEASQEIDVEYTGPALTVGFNAHYLLDVLAQVGEGGVRIELSDHISPALVRPIEARDLLGVVMPMRV